MKPILAKLIKQDGYPYARNQPVWVHEILDASEKQFKINGGIYRCHFIFQFPHGVDADYYQEGYVDLTSWKTYDKDGDGKKEWKTFRCLNGERAEL